MISHTNTKTPVSKIFNFSSTLAGSHRFQNSHGSNNVHVTSPAIYVNHMAMSSQVCLSIIPNLKLTGQNAKGPKYREPCKLIWIKIRR